MDVEYTDPDYEYEAGIYEKRVYNGWGRPEPETPLRFGPNIKDWPEMPALTDDLLVKVCSYITDPVTTTDELIPSGETSSYRSNCINWRITPFLVETPEVFALGDYIFIPGVRKAVLENAPRFTAYAVKPDGAVTPFQVSTGSLTDAERQIIVDGCLINYYRSR